MYKQVLVGEDALLKRVKSMELENMKLRKKLEEVRLWKLFCAHQVIIVYEIIQGLPADERHQVTQ